MPRTWFGRGTAIFFPALLCVLFAAWLGAPPGRSDVQFADARQLDARLAATNPELMVVGTSMAHRNLDLQALGEGLGLQPFDASVPGSSAPVWYILLKDRVYAGGYHPKVVLVVGTVEQQLQLAPKTAWERISVVGWSNGPDLAVEARMAGAPAVAAGSWRTARAAQVRTSLVDGLRSGAVGLLFAPFGDGTLLARGAAVADAASKAVMGEGGAAAGADLDEDDDNLGSPDASFVADLASLVEGDGGRLVFVDLPIRDDHRTPKQIARRTELAAWLAQNDVEYVDLTGLPVRHDEFVDLVHMTPDGTQRVTQALLAVLRGDRPPTPQVDRPKVERRGDPAPLPIDLASATHLGRCLFLIPTPGLTGLAHDRLADRSLPAGPWVVTEAGAPLPEADVRPRDCGEGWLATEEGLVVATSDPTIEPAALDVTVVDGPAIEIQVPPTARYGGITPIDYEGSLVRRAQMYWVPPGTELAITVPVGEALSGSALVVVPGSTGARVRLGEREVAPTVAGAVLQLDGLVPAPEEAILRWASPPDGPWLVVRDLVVRDEYLLGSRETGIGQSELLLGKARYFGPPPPIAQAPMEPMDKLTARIAVHDAGWLDLDRVSALTNREACVPVQLTQGDHRVDVRALGPGATFNRPADLDRTGRLVWNPDRVCTWWPNDPTRANLGRTAQSRKTSPVLRARPPGYFERIGQYRWLYPRDVAEFVLPHATGLQDVARALRVVGVRPGQVGDLRVELEVAGAPAGTWTIPAIDGERVDAWLPLDRPIPNDAGPIVLRLRSDGFAQLSSVALVER